MCDGEEGVPDSLNLLRIPQISTPERESFKAYREALQLSFPVPEAEVEAALLEWLSGTNGQEESDGEGNPWSFEADLGWTAAGSATDLSLTWVRVRASSLIRARSYLPAAELRAPRVSLAASF